MSKYGSNVNLNLIKTFNFIKHMHSMDKLLHYIGYQDNEFYSLRVTLLTAGQMYSHYSDP